MFTKDILYSILGLPNVSMLGQCRRPLPSTEPALGVYYGQQFNPYNAEIFLSKPCIETEDFFQF